MYKFTLPNYKGKSIVNLMSSISNSFGKKHKYSELISLNSDELKKFKNVVLIVIDGLGYNYLKKQKDSFLLENLKSNITSTFLSTTACANTAFLVGYPPQQHALTGWEINLKEIGTITKILPFTPIRCCHFATIYFKSDIKYCGVMGIYCKYSVTAVPEQPT